VLDIDTVLELHQNIVLRGIGEKYWALNVSTGNQYRLNEMSYFILDIFRTPQTIASVLDTVLKEYNVDRERLMSDCRTVLQSAIEKNILKEIVS
jgi:hypothetical protein